MAQNVRDLVNKENSRLVYKIIEDEVYDENGNQVQTPAEGAVVFGQNPGNELIQKVKNAFELMKTGNIQEVVFGGDEAKSRPRRYLLRFYLRCIDEPNNPNNPKYMQQEVNSLKGEDKDKVRQAINELITISRDKEGKEVIEINEEKFYKASSNVQQRYEEIPNSADNLKDCKIPTNFEMIFISEPVAARWYYIKNLKEYIAEIEGAEEQQRTFERLMRVDEIKGESAAEISMQYGKHVKDVGLTSVAAIDSTSYVKRKGLDLQQILQNDYGMDIPVIFKGVNFFPKGINPNNFDEVNAHNPRWAITYFDEAKEIVKHMKDSDIERLSSICEIEEQEAKRKQSDEFGENGDSRN